MFAVKSALLLLIVLSFVSVGRSVSVSPPEPALPGGPIQFLDIEMHGPDARVILTDEGKKFLDGLPPKQPPVVVAVVGRNSRGKSYLMNQILGRIPGDTAFEVADQPTSTTRGVLAWNPAPCLRRLGNNDPNLVPSAQCRDGDRRVIFWDTQGLQAPDFPTVALDQTLFSVAMLVCSTIVYNVDRKIDSDNFRELSGVVTLAELIDTGEDRALSQFPSILWAIQGSQQALDFNSTEYLYSVLKEFSDPKSQPSTQRVAQTLRRSPGHVALALPPPVTDTRLWPRLPSLSRSQLDEEYVAAIDSLRGDLFNLLLDSPAQGRSAGARELTVFLESLLAVLRDHPVPEPGDVASQLRSSALDHTEALFNTRIASVFGACEGLHEEAESDRIAGCVPLTVDELRAKLDDIETEIRESTEVFFVDEEILSARVSDLRHRALGDNSRYSQIVCRAALSDAERALTTEGVRAQAEAANRFELQVYREQRMNVEEVFRSRCRGPAEPKTAAAFRLVADRQEARVARSTVRSALLGLIILCCSCGFGAKLLGNTTYGGVNVQTAFGTLCTTVAVLTFLLGVMPLALSLLNVSNIGVNIIILFVRLWEHELAPLLVLSALCVLVILIVVGMKQAEPIQVVAQPITPAVLRNREADMARVREVSPEQSAEADRGRSGSVASVQSGLWDGFDAAAEGGSVPPPAI